MSTVRQRKTTSLPRKCNESKNEDIVPDAGWCVFFKVSLFVFIILPFLGLLAGILLIDSPIDPVQSERLPEPSKLEGPLAPNDLLVFQGERLFEGQLEGPESIVYQSGHLYTGTADGKILHIELSSKTIDTIVSLGTPPCGKLEYEDHCGRPLGMRFDKNGYLIVADAYLGLYKINVASRDVFQLVPGNLSVGGHQLRFLNDLDIASDGTIYFTDTSRFRRREFIFDLLEGKATGRLLKYVPAENKTEVLYRNLYFANGIQLSKDNSYILVVETSKVRILKYYLQGDKQGQMEVFANNLPGFPDGIRRSSGGGYWVTLGHCRYDGHFNIFDFLQQYPWIRKQLAKIPVSLFMLASPHCGMVIELDKDGNIVQSLQDRSGERFQQMSHVEEDAGYLYIGSYSAPYIGKVNTYKKPVKSMV